MTKTESLKCHFCSDAATALKREAEYVETEQADGTVTGTWDSELLPICEGCDEENYDGTEQYPALLPLN